MSSNFEKSVKGGTKVKAAPPKSKYVEHILLATQSGEAGVAEVFRTLIHRLRDSTWTVVFKSLIIVHLMIKEGAEDVTLRYLAVAPKNRLAINSFTDVQTQGQNIRRYSEYLLARAQAFAASKCDHVRSGNGRMKRLSVDKGLLRETEIIQDQIRALVRCDLLSTDVENEISLTAFRLLTRDLLDLYHVENEAVMNVLSHYFEMSKPDAERAIQIYKAFCKQTDLVVQYLGVARQYEHATRLEIPKIKHAPTSLAQSLQEYIDDKDFEVNRRQYLAEQEAKRTGKPFQKSAPMKSQPSAPAVAPTASKPEAAVAAKEVPKGPAPDLIDFFESIEQNQTQMAPAPQQFQQQQQAFTAQQTGVMPQPSQQQPFGFQQQPQQPGANGFVSATNPFGQPQQQQPAPQPIQTQFTGAGFGGYGPQPTGQQQFAPTQAFSPVQSQSPAQMQSPQGIQPQATGTNPFRQSTMPIGASSVASSSPFAPQGPGLQRQSTNPFARHTQAPTMTGSAFSSIPEDQPFQPQQHSSFAPQPQPQPLQSQPTGTNPFARNVTGAGQQVATPPMSPPNALQVQPTGSTNPFRQSAFVNQATGQGWQNAPQGSMGGLEGLETIPVFPRPGQAPQQAGQQSPWG
jgi:phosphatidylinositol-binding clathrin assembly protein